MSNAPDKGPDDEGTPEAVIVAVTIAAVIAVIIALAFLWRFVRTLDGSGLIALIVAIGILIFIAVFADNPNPKE